MEDIECRWFFEQCVRDFYASMDLMDFKLNVINKSDIPLGVMTSFDK